MFKTDLSRAYRQIFLRYSFFAAYNCQRVTNMIGYILRLQNVMLDDFGDADTTERCSQSFAIMSETLERIDAKENINKTYPPSGMELRVTQERLSEIRNLLLIWINLTYASKLLLSLLGKLQFVCKCVKPRRVFISRLRGLNLQNHKDAVLFT